MDEQTLRRLYPEISAAGGDVSAALEQVAADEGLDVGRLDPVEGRPPRLSARSVLGEATFDVFATNTDEREFWLEISTESGWPWGAFGSTPDVRVAVEVLHAWRSGVSLPDLRGTRPWLARSPLDAAPTGRVVATAWRLTLERARCIRLGNPAIAEALYAEPVLRGFFPFPSHGEFSLLSSTADPFREELPRVVPAGDGLWDVVLKGDALPVRGASGVLGTGLGPSDAAALVAASVPEGCGPAVEGGWPEQEPSPDLEEASGDD